MSSRRLLPGAVCGRPGHPKCVPYPHRTNAPEMCVLWNKTRRLTRRRLFSWGHGRQCGSSRPGNAPGGTERVSHRKVLSSKGENWPR